MRPGQDGDQTVHQFLRGRVFDRLLPNLHQFLDRLQQLERANFRPYCDQHGARRIMFLSRDLFLFYGVSPPDRFAFDWKTMPQVTACLYFRTHLIANLGEIWVT